MKINYNVMHPLLGLRELKDLRSQRKITTWLLLCQIAWISKSNKSCQLYQAQVAADFGTDDKFIRKCLKHLIDLGLIEITSKYQRDKQKPNTYKPTQKLFTTIAEQLSQRDLRLILPKEGSVLAGPKLGPGGSKAVSHQDTVKNITKSNIKPHIGDDFNQSPPNVNHQPRLTLEQEAQRIAEAKRKMEENSARIRAKQTK